MVFQDYNLLVNFLIIPCVVSSLTLSIAKHFGGLTSSHEILNCTETSTLNIQTTGTYLTLHPYFLKLSIHQLKKQRLKEKIEADVGALVQFLLDERDSLLESLDAEEVATMAVIDDNLKIVESEENAVDKAIANIHTHTSGKTNFEVSVTYH